MAGMVVQHNMNALGAYNKLNTNVNGLKKSSEKLASGYRINRAGDDAAGLAISEKMRSQIRGLNQAKRNSQDGISMIQTYEGALQESHSILQRMKELAAESANGTYQDEVDRDAIQLEFNQLNDELNQIADTDFNGVVMLNGGEMADGTKAVDGKFDYANNTRDAMQLGTADIKTLDNKGWNETTANTAWASWSASKNPAYSRTDTDRSNDGPESTDVTFKYNAADGTWSAIEATNGMNVDDINNCVDNTGKTGTDLTATNGGFSVLDAAGGNEVANVVVDTSTLKDGDTITISFKNPALGKTTPENVGVSSIDDSSFIAGTDGAGAGKADVNDVTITLNNTINSTNSSKTTILTEDEAKLYEMLQGAKVEATYAAGTVAATAFKLTLADGTEITSAANTAGTAFKIGETNFYLGAAAGTAGTSGSELTINSKADGSGTEYLSFTAATGYNNTGTGAVVTSGKVTYTLAVAESKYDDDGVSATVVEPTGDSIRVSKSDSNGAATAPLTYQDNLVLQAGARTKDSVDFTFNYKTDGMGELKANLDVSSRANGLNTANLSLATQEDANAAIDQIDNAINKVSMVRATFGATQNRLEHKIENLTTTAENLTEAESTIRDTDMASEMMNYTKFNILQQAAQSMLAQANQQPQSILQLLG